MCGCCSRQKADRWAEELHISPGLDLSAKGDPEVAVDILRVHVSKQNATPLPRSQCANIDVRILYIFFDVEEIVLGLHSRFVQRQRLL